MVKDTKTNDLIDVKLCDYGLSKKVLDYQEISGSTILGTVDYFAPELYAMMEKRMAGDSSKMSYNYKVDVWSYGVLLYFSLYGRTIMEPPGSRYSVMKQRKIEFPPIKGAPEEYIKLIKRALTFDPDARPSFSELLNDPFFTKVELRKKTKLNPYTVGKYITKGESGITKLYYCTKNTDPYIMKQIDR